MKQLVPTAKPLARLPVDADTPHQQAEISSPYVTAGGPYFWSGCARLAACL